MQHSLSKLIKNIENARVLSIGDKGMSEGLEQFIKVIENNYDDMLTEEEVSQLLGFSKMYLCKLRRKKESIPFIRFGKLIRYFKVDVINWIRVSKLRSNDDYPCNATKNAKKTEENKI